MSKPKTDVTSLDNSALRDLLENNGYGEFDVIIKEQNLNGADFMKLTQLELKKWKLPSLFVEKKLLQCLSQIQGNPHLFTCKDDHAPDNKSIVYHSSSAIDDTFKRKLENCIGLGTPPRNYPKHTILPKPPVALPKQREIVRNDSPMAYSDDDSYLLPAHSMSNSLDQIAEDIYDVPGKNCFNFCHTLKKPFGSKKSGPTTERIPLILPRPAMRSSITDNDELNDDDSYLKESELLKVQKMKISDDGIYDVPKVFFDFKPEAVKPNLMLSTPDFLHLTPVQSAKPPVPHTNNATARSPNNKIANSSVSSIENIATISERLTECLVAKLPQSKLPYDPKIVRHEYENVSFSENSYNTPRPLPKLPPPIVEYEEPPVLPMKFNADDERACSVLIKNHGKNLHSLEDNNLLSMKIKDLHRLHMEIAKATPIIKKRRIVPKKNGTGVDTSNARKLPLPPKTVGPVPDDHMKMMQQIRSLPEVPQVIYNSYVFPKMDGEFYRPVDRIGATMLLKSLEDGAFLFRPCISNKDLSLTLTIKYSDNQYFNVGIELTKNNQIRCQSEGAKTCPSFDTLDDFVNHFSSVPLTLYDEQNEGIKTILLKKILPNRHY